ncbi:MAG: GH36-type glycosyl hydrolase domain-containing protein [Candidatus Hodarchaeota archaeon]
MKYGFFDNEKKEYIITRPDTPTPWINYLSNSEYCAMISNCAGGYSFHIDPKDRRILRYRYNNLPYDRPGRYIYIRDENTSEYWSSSWQPVLKELDSYECRHGLGYTIIKSLKEEVESEVTYFVPLTENLEIWKVCIRNTSSQSKILRVFSYAEFCLWRAENDLNDLQYIQNVAYTEFSNNVIFYSLYDRHPGYAFFASNGNVISYDCDREEFIGAYRDESNPLCVEEGTCSNSIAIGGNPIAATCNEIVLAPEEMKTIIFVLGVTPKIEDASPIIKKFLENHNVELEFKKLNKFWDSYLSKFQVKTPDKEFDTIVNIWNPYQCRTTFDWSRYVSFYETGIGRGMGFRDSSQDTLGINYTLPDRVRQRLLDLAQNQFQNGHAFHLYFPLTGKGGFPDYTNPSKPYFSDDHLWLIIAVHDYIKETGDIDILNQQVQFADTDTSTILYDHLKRAVDFTRNHMGNHGLPLIGTADWNDTLNLPGPNNAGESLWVALQLNFALSGLIELANELEQKDDVEDFQTLRNNLKDHVNNTAWDGEYYIRAYTDSGKVIGSKKCEKGKIYLNPQSWAVLSNIASTDRAIQALNAVKEHLDTEYGVMLLTPPYDGYRHDLGGITVYPPSLKENNAIFCHTNPWLILAECILGRGDYAFEYYKKISPTTKNRMADIHRTEPYVFSQMITGKFHQKFGAAKNSWLTGTAAWTMRSAHQGILGIQPQISGLRVDPCIPKEWDSFTVVRHFRGSIYDIRVKNPNHVSKGIKKIIVDDKKIEGDLIPIFTDEKTHIIDITMG